MTPARLALLAQLGTTLPLVGLIWLVQVLVYPQMARVGAGDFAAYHAAHTRLITYVVAPLMLVELGAAIGAVTFDDPTLPRGVAWVGLGLAASAWAVTMLLSVPRHELLARGFDVDAHGSLVSTNWLRTIAWTARGALVLWAAWRAVGTGPAP